MNKKTLEGCNCRFQNTPHTEGGHKVHGRMVSMCAAGLPFPVPEVLDLKAFCDLGFLISELSSRTFEKGPETAKAFSSFLMIEQLVRASGFCSALTGSLCCQHGQHEIAWIPGRTWQDPDFLIHVSGEG